jgi:hypothetical protein
MRYPSWIGFDLDGTLAYYEKGGSMEKVGPPIPKMMSLLRSYMLRGYTVKIFTARANEERNVKIVQEWLNDHGIGELEITCIKDPGMQILFDDRAVQVTRNEGDILGDINLISVKRE